MSLLSSGREANKVLQGKEAAERVTKTLSWLKTRVPRVGGSGILQRTGQINYILERMTHVYTSKPADRGGIMGSAIARVTYVYIRPTRLLFRLEAGP